jgi:hypothetical protein
MHWGVSRGNRRRKNRASPARSVLLTLDATNKTMQRAFRPAFKHVAYARDPIIFHVPPPLSYIHPSHTSIHLSLCSFCPPSRHTVKIIILDYSVERQQWLAGRSVGLRATAESGDCWTPLPAGVTLTEEVRAAVPPD